MQGNMLNYFSPKKNPASQPAGSPMGVKRNSSQESTQEVGRDAKRHKVDNDTKGTSASQFSNPQSGTSSYFKPRPTLNNNNINNSNSNSNSNNKSTSQTGTQQNGYNTPNPEQIQDDDEITAEMLDIDDFVLPITQSSPAMATSPSPIRNPSTSFSTTKSPAQRSMSTPSLQKPSQPPAKSQVQSPARPLSKPSKTSKTTKTTKSTKSSKSSKTRDDDYEEDDEEEESVAVGKKKGGKYVVPHAKEAARFRFLADVHDEHGNKPDSPDYDPTTLRIPNSEYLNLSPFERQYWDVKRKFFDTMIFFKKGKFYELYEQDADIAHKMLDLKLTERVNMRMAGVPEAHFATWAGKLLQLGYKVGKVDELETGIGMAKRQSKEGAKKTKDTIIRRELTGVLTAGTLTDPSLIPDHTTHYLLALKEDKLTYGFALIDAAGGVIHLGQFEDDMRLSTLETLLLQTSPKEVLYEKGAALSPVAFALIKRTLIKPSLQGCDDTAFCDSHATLRNLAEGGYYHDGNFPASFKSTLREIGGEKEADGCTLALSALGACVWYLQTLRQDRSLLSLGNYKAYSVNGGDAEEGRLVLDGTSILNLEILTNSTDGSVKGSLLGLLNRCTTPFGKRLFRGWVLRPLRHIPTIEDRLDAVDDLLSVGGLMEDLTKRLAQLPDMERLVSRAHAHSCRLTDFVNLLQSMELVQAITYEVFSDEMRSECKSQQLKEMEFPDLNAELEEMHSYFNWDDARSTGRILPQKGLSTEYDATLATIEDIKNKLEKHLKTQMTDLGYKIQFKDVGKERYQLELAKSTKVPNAYELVSQTKNVDRYYTSYIRSLLGPLAEAEDTAAVLLRDVLLLLQQKFDAHHEKWVNTVGCVSHIDALLSLAKASSQTSPMCRPVFVNGPEAILHIKNGRHPCIIPQLGGDVIPNDLFLGTAPGSENHPPVMVLTGPNMGGKSTLLRQACLTAIMAQLGCYVPAEACTLTPSDRVFTRLGARDDIVAGQSTFMIELQETANMLKYATNKSLVILDELGRGTSTFDGYAIAYAVLMHLASKVHCRTLFSTHYHTLTEEVGHIPGVGVNHMASVVDDEKREVTFLYRVTPGTCPRSYGLHVASMAGIPKSVVDEAEDVANKLHASLLSRLTSRIAVALRNNDAETLMILWRAAKGRRAAWSV